METDPPTTPIAAPTADPAATPTTSRAALTADLTTACETPDFKDGMRIRDRLGQVGVLTSKVTRCMGGGKYDWNVTWSLVGGKSEQKPENLNQLDYDFISSGDDDETPTAPTSQDASGSSDGRTLRQAQPSTPPQVTGHGTGSASSTPASVASTSTPISPFPEHWTGGELFVDITPEPRAREQSDEYARVKESLMGKLEEGAWVQQVWRVQNESAWGHFEIERKKLVGLGFLGEEPELWHSTSTTDPFKVCKDGFDLTYSKVITNPNDEAARSSAYGLGLYFAAHPLYSHCIVPCPATCADTKYVKDRTGYLLIRVRMLLGNVKDYGAEEQTTRVHTPEGYHSWTGTEGNLQLTFEKVDLKHDHDLRKLKANGKTMGRQYITQNASMVYPEYIIRYTRE